MFIKITNKMKNLKQYTFIILSALTIASCQKEDTEITNSSEKKTIEIESKLVLHKNYDANLSQEEAMTRFNEDLKKYMSENKTKSANNGWHYTLQTKTGDNGTDSDVYSITQFNTQNFIYFTSQELNLSNKNDRQPNSWDIYSIHTDVETPDWVELEKSTISLRGTDGWDLDNLHVLLVPSQNPNTSGSSIIIDNPNVKLDNDTACDECWDHYFTGSIGTGRLTFN